MKKVFCLTIILLSAVSFLAQERTIEKSTFDAALKSRFRKYAGQSYRLTTSAENILPSPNGGKVTWRSVSEFAVPRANRLVYEFDSPAVKSKTETVIIDGKIYSRKDGGEWTVKDFPVKNDEPTAPKVKFVVLEEQTEYKWLGTQILDKISTNVYAKIEKKKQLNEENKSEIYSSSVTKYWLDQDGGIVKEETLTENQHKLVNRPLSGIYRSLRTSVWEFDPNIKIEAPILN